MATRPAIALLCIAFAATLASQGCATRHDPAPERDFTVLYAELMLLNEQEHITHPVPDSLYRLHAAAILSKHGTTEEDFRKRSNALMGDSRAWRDFLGQVSVVFDSMKTARPLPPK